MSEDSFIDTAWADDSSTDLSDEHRQASWGRVSVGLATLALLMSVGGTITLAVLAADPGWLPDVLIPLSLDSIVLSVALAAVGAVFAVIGLVRREGTRALAGLGLVLAILIPGFSIWVSPVIPVALRGARRARSGLGARG